MGARDRLREFFLANVGRVVEEDATPGPAIGPGIDPATRAAILLRNGYTCQACGAGAGDTHQDDPAKNVRLHIDHVIPRDRGGTNDADNLRALCSVCNEGRSNLQIQPSERALNILGYIRRAPKDVQREVFNFLRRKFTDPPEE